jgi:cbb3-type cytochrome oxidase subunit 3
MARWRAREGDEMKLSDVVSHSGLAGYAEVALVLFLIAFVAIVIRVFLPSRKSEMDRASRLPLEPDGAGTPHPGARP